MPRPRAPMRLGGAFLLASALALLPVAATDALAQVSPGPLSRAHAHLEGGSHCLECHGHGTSAQNQRCLACHKEIGTLQQAGRGFHARTAGRECAGCHPEHAGTDFALIAWEGGGPERFDHSSAGFALEGKHATLKCAACHKPEFQRGAVMPLLKNRRPEKSWLGLEPACNSCHDDPHRGALGADCRRCHGVNAWKPAAGFDHARTEFPLAGKHAAVECGKCHLAPHLALAHDPQGRPVPVYKPLPHAECSACHQDPHAGRLGLKCAACHTAVAWAQVERTAFDHAKTRYPLLGRHASVPCAACHDPKKPDSKRPPFATCDACHADPHAGKATIGARKVDCAACHRVEGWRPSTFTVAQHDSAPYPLAGKHRQVACEKCHPQREPGAVAADLGKARVVLRRPSARCADCHQDAHGGQLAARADGGACEKCHTVEGWKPSLFGVAEHGATRLPLDGRHRQAACEACHGPARKGLPPLPDAKNLGSAGVALVGLPTECTACHVDPHAGRFAAGGPRPRAGGCTACHDAAAFRPSRFDAALHREAGYPLDGAHRAVPCVACHAELKEPAAASSLAAAGAPSRTLRFEEKNTACAQCHRTPHGEQFAARSDHGACEACHGVESFRPASRFDHVGAASFRLDGAHAKVACGRCHFSRSGPDGSSQILYRPLPHRCEDCHRSGTPPAGKPPASPAGAKPGSGGRTR